MRHLAYITAALALCLLPGCKTGSQISAPPEEVKSAEPLRVEEQNRLSQISAQAEAAEVANSMQATSPAQTATAGPISGIRTLSGLAKESDRKAALEAVNAALSGDLIRAKSGWALAKADAEALNNRILELQSAAKAEREQAARDRIAEVAAARSEERKKAEAKERLIYTLVFFGGAGVFAIGAVLCGQFAMALPIMGPNIIRMLWAASAISGVIGLLLRTIDRMMDEHPYLFYTGVGLIGATLTTAGVLAWSNHNHDKAA
jgi:hypothetical protein